MTSTSPPVIAGSTASQTDDHAFALAAARATAWELALRGADAGLSDVWACLCERGPRESATPRPLMPRDALQRWGPPLQELLRGRINALTIEHAVPGREGPRWVRSTLEIAERDRESGHPVRLRGVNVDIGTERAHAAALTAHIGRLEREVATLESFNETVTRELRGAARAAAEAAGSLLADHANTLPEPCWLLAERVAASSRSLIAMIEGLHDLAGLARQPLRRRAVDLAALAREAWSATHTAQPGRDVTLATAFCGDTVVWADRTLALELLRHLLGNALKFTRASAAAWIVVGSSGEGAERLCFVRDNGCGFDPAEAEGLFRPFGRLHDGTEFEGAGLGLATARRIVERHGGRLWSESRPGEGATFFFTLPDDP